MKKMILLAAMLGLTSALTASAADAKANWTSLCVKCHGEDGRGQTKQGRKLKIPDLSDKKVQGLFTDDQAFKIIKEGVKDDNEKVAMKAAEGVDDDDIRALVQHIRTLKK